MSRKKKTSQRLVHVLDELNHKVENFAALHDELLEDGKLPQSALEPLRKAHDSIVYTWYELSDRMLTSEMKELINTTVQPIHFTHRFSDIKRLTNNTTEEADG